jgi:exportin-2 (importin alpha re-exporter)
LANDVTEFFPYAFQLLAQLVELNSPQFLQSTCKFLSLLSPNWWKRTSNVQALVRELNQESRLSEVHSIFSWLISSPVTAKHGSYVLSTVIQNLEYGVIAPYICGIWKDLFAAGRKLIRKFCQVFLDKHVTFHSQT